MVSVKFKGRLGNNLFQFAAAYALSLRNNVGLIHFEDAENYTVYKEKSFGYNEIPYNGSVVLDGYFQSEKYFIDFKDEVLKEIRGYLDFKILKPINKISIHVRRGDYLQTNCHPPITLDYINSAVNYFKGLGYKDDDFLLFTDDKEWCSANLPFKISNGNELQDLELMSLCTHNIIANSSYSYWGQYLNQNPNKIVIAPKVWFGGRKANLNTDDLYCKNWIKI